MEESKCYNVILNTNLINFLELVLIDGDFEIQKTKKVKNLEYYIYCHRIVKMTNITNMQIYEWWRNWRWGPFGEDIFKVKEVFETSNVNMLISRSYKSTNNGEITFLKSWRPSSKDIVGKADKFTNQDEI